MADITDIMEEEVGSEAMVAEVEEEGAMAVVVEGLDVRWC